MSVAQKIFDRETMLERLGGDDELLGEVVELFSEECPGMIAALRSAISAQNSKAMQLAAHSLKGALLNIAADSAAEVACKLEDLADEAQFDGTESLFAELTQALEQLDSELNSQS